MRVIEVLAPGLLTTVQDLGREGFGPMGVSPSGAADPVALRIGNRLVGNAESAAALEMTLLGGTFLFPEGALVALTGSDFGAALEGEDVPPWTSFEVKPGQTLRLGPTRSGARCYLCIQGGIAVKPFLGSASTHLLSGLGGYEGRALRKGDVLETADSNGAKGTGLPVFSSCSNRTLRTNRCKKVMPKIQERFRPSKILRVTSGPQSGWFSQAAEKVLYGGTYRVSEQANRMGLRLQGPPIPEGAHGGMISEGVSLGAVQIAAGGMPIILFVEQQTTGGYAKIANVISADFASLGQLRPRDEIRFKRVTFETARKLLMEQEELLTAKDLIVETKGDR
jgi:antagonist of KipI